MNPLAETTVLDVARYHCAVRHVVSLSLGDCVEQVPGVVYQAVVAVSGNEACPACDVFVRTLVEQAAGSACGTVVGVCGEEGGDDVEVGDVAASDDVGVELMEEGERGRGFGEEEGEGAGVGGNGGV